MMRALAHALHNVVVHPVCGVLWLVADLLELPRLDALAERLHQLTAVD